MNLALTKKKVFTTTTNTINKPGLFIPSQCSECTCTLRVTKRQWQFRMETRCFSFSRDCNTHGTTNSGSVCIEILPLSSTIYCMETRPRQNSNKCVPASMRYGVRFRLSSIQLDNTVSKEDPRRRKDRSTNHSNTHMANSDLVCTTSKNVCTALISGKNFVNKYKDQRCGRFLGKFVNRRNFMQCCLAYLKFKGKKPNN